MVALAREISRRRIIVPLVSKLRATNAPKGLAVLTHLKTVSDDGIVVVRQARANYQIGDGGEAALPRCVANTTFRCQTSGEQSNT